MRDKAEPIPDPKPVPAGAPVAAPCTCCEKIQIILEYVKVIKKTEALGFISLTDDDVYVTAVSRGKWVVEPVTRSWPELDADGDFDPKGFGEGEYEDNLEVILAEIEPTVKCEVNFVTVIKVWKANFGSDLAQAFAMTLQEASTLLPIPIPGLDKNSFIKKLLKKTILRPFRDDEMGTITIRVDKKLCKEQKIDELKELRPFNDTGKTEQDPNKTVKIDEQTLQLTRHFKKKGGEWIVKIRLERKCP